MRDAILFTNGPMTTLNHVLSPCDMTSLSKNKEVDHSKTTCFHVKILLVLPTSAMKNITNSEQSTDVNVVD